MNVGAFHLNIMKMKFQFKELTLQYYSNYYYKISKHDTELNVIMIEALNNILCSKALLRLSLDFISPEIVKQ